MRFRTKLVLTFFLLMVLNGCATGLQPEIDITPEVLRDIKTITIIKPPEIQYIHVADARHKAYIVPLVGQIVAETDLHSKGAKLTEALRRQNFSVSLTLVEQVSENLSRLGFKTSWKEGFWKKIEGKYSLQYENIQPEADAVLVIEIGRFISTRFFVHKKSKKYMPSVSASALLVDKTSENPLYSGNYYSWGRWDAVNNEFAQISSGETFSSFDEILANPEKAVTSLRSAAMNVADSITSDFKF